MHLEDRAHTHKQTNAHKHTRTCTTNVLLNLDILFAEDSSKAHYMNMFMCPSSQGH